MPNVVEWLQKIIWQGQNSFYTNIAIYSIANLFCSIWSDLHTNILNLYKNTQFGFVRWKKWEFRIHLVKWSTCSGFVQWKFIESQLYSLLNKSVCTLICAPYIFLTMTPITQSLSSIHLRYMWTFLLHNCYPIFIVVNLVESLLQSVLNLSHMSL